MALPFKSVGYDRIQLLKFRRPRKGRANTRHIGNQDRRIALATLPEHDKKLHTAHALYRLYHLHDRCAAAVTAIECRARAARAQIAKRGRMRGGEVGDMDVVANARA